MTKVSSKTIVSIALLATVIIASQNLLLFADGFVVPNSSSKQHGVNSVSQRIEKPVVSLQSKRYGFEVRQARREQSRRKRRERAERANKENDDDDNTKSATGKSEKRMIRVLKWPFRRIQSIVRK